MGLPAGKLMLATNENNILERFVQEGVYEPGEFRGTYSPSMDIQVASNFERYLYYLYGEDGAQISSLMNSYKSEGKIDIPADNLSQVQADFVAYGVKNEECLSTIGAYHKATGYLLDPHTACGVAAADKLADDGEVTVALSTAHPAKFDESIQLVGIKQSFPAQIGALFDKPQHQTIVEGTNEAIAAQVVKFYET
jgi:threonine synthase